MKIFVAALSLALCVMTNAEAAKSITYTVGGWQITVTDLYKYLYTFDPASRDLSKSITN